MKLALFMFFSILVLISFMSLKAGISKAKEANSLKKENTSLKEEVKRLKTDCYSISWKERKGH